MVWKLFGKKKPADYEQNLKAARDAGGGESLPVQDTRAAIEELSQVVKSDPEAVEIYLALGSLYRSQGEIERAIQIRNSLILRPGLDREFKARALFELGRDFRRGGFLDRAEKAFKDARAHGHPPKAIHAEMARLSAERGFYEKAAESYGQLDLPLPQAHYLVKLATDHLAEGNLSQAHRSLRHAIRAFPGSIEAWLEQISLAYKAGNTRKLADLLRDGMDNVAPRLRFTLLEGLMAAMKRAELAAKVSPEDEHEWAKACTDAQVVKAVLPVLEKFEPDVLTLYYGGMFQLRIEDVDGARAWLERTLVLDSQFWLARLELFDLSRSDQTFTPFFKDQLNFFMDRARRVRRFYCNRCGLKRDQLFFNCPRCHSWHSITFRTDFSQ